MRKSSPGNPWHDERGRFCHGPNATVDSAGRPISDEQRQEAVCSSVLPKSAYERRSEERFAREAQKSYDMNSQDGVKDYLSAQFEANGYKEVSVMTDEGWVVVKPCYYGDDPSTTEYYMVEGPRPWMGGDTLDDISKQIANISADVKEEREDKKRLAKFYEDNIAGATEEDWALSREISSRIYDDWGGQEGSLSDFFNSHAAEYAEKFGKSPEEVEKAWNLSQDYGFYSDWHKDLYGVRPH